MKAARIYDSMERALLRERIGAYRHRYWRLKNEDSALAEEIKGKVDQEMWLTVDRITQGKAGRIGAQNAKKKDNKWEKLTKEAQKRAVINDNTLTGAVRADNDRSELVAVKRPVEGNTSSEPSKRRVVINLSGKELPQEAMEVLSRGLNFAVVPKRIPKEELITNIEAALTHMQQDAADDIRLEAAHLIRRAKPPRENITFAQRRALMELKKREDVVVTRADKGSATVVLSRSSYEDKMEALLNPGTYEKGVRDPTRTIENKIKRILKNEEVDKRLAAEMAPGDARVPRIYGLPKIHKKDTPLRPIVSMLGAPTYRASKALARRLRPFVGNSFSAVRNSSHLVELLKDMRLSEGDVLVSFDVEALFTSLPVKDSLEIIKRKKFLEGAMMELAEVCLTSCYFQYNNVVYKQREGVAMGSPLSSVVADVFMEEFERQLIDAVPHKPRLWLRYVDDVFAVWQHGPEELEKFLALLNDFHSSIKFTMEKEKDGRLPFLDLLIIRQDDGTLAHTVYRKPTATGRYLHAESHHHPAQKMGVIKTLTHRALRLCSSEALLKAELAQLKEDFAWNGYATKDVDRTMKAVLKKKEDPGPGREKEEPKQRVTLPYVRGVSEKIGRLFRDQGVEVAFKPLDKVCDWLGSAKDRQWLQDKGVYLLPCDCGAVYVGQTGKKVATRIGQHCADYRLRRTKTSAVARHGEECSKQMLFDQVKILAKEEILEKRLVREAIEIYKRPTNMNGDDGLALPGVWRPALKEVRASVERRAAPATRNLPIGPPRMTTEEPDPYIYGPQTGRRHSLTKRLAKYDSSDEAREAPGEN